MASKDFDRETRRVACSGCGVVSEVTVTRHPSEDMAVSAGQLATPRIVGDDECAVCGSTLSFPKRPGIGGGQL